MEYQKYQHYMYITIVGMRYTPVNYIFSSTDNGKIFFEKEPTNQYDPNAVKVIVNSTHVAYVCSENAVSVGAMLDKTSEYSAGIINIHTAKDDFGGVQQTAIKLRVDYI